MSDLPKSREPDELVMEHKSPMVDGTVDRKQMRQEQTRLQSGCSSL